MGPSSGEQTTGPSNKSVAGQCDAMFTSYMMSKLLVSRPEPQRMGSFMFCCFYCMNYLFCLFSKISEITFVWLNVCRDSLSNNCRAFK